MSLLIAGIGGTGVVTLGRILGRAAESEGKAVSVTDQTGLAQKGGAVLSHLRIAADPAQIGAARIGPARDGIDGADVILGCDLVVTAGGDVLSRAKPGAKAVVNEAQAITGSFLREPDKRFPADGLREVIARRLSISTVFVDAGALAARHGGRSSAANLLLLGYAWQKGLIPIGADAIRHAIEQTFAGRGAATVASNLAAFDGGGRAATDGSPAASGQAPQTPPSRDDLVEHRAAAIADYQNAALASRYRVFVARVHETESLRTPGRQDLTDAVARGYYKLLAVKDEYEVARLFTAPAFRDRLARQFEGGYRVHFHLAPAILSGATGGARPRKRRFGPWLMPVLRLLAACRGLRGTVLDPFARTAERKLERALRREYEQSIATILDSLSAETHALAVDIARLPESIRGFGPVKQGAADTARRRREELLVRMNQSRKVHAATIAAE
jgi:indolepyruvate ferredoxin oxidoreductase